MCPGYTQTDRQIHKGMLPSALSPCFAKLLSRSQGVDYQFSKQFIYHSRLQLFVYMLSQVASCHFHFATVDTEVTDVLCENSLELFLSGGHPNRCRTVFLNSFKYIRYTMILMAEFNPAITRNNVSASIITFRTFLGRFIIPYLKKNNNIHEAAIIIYLNG